MDSESGMKWVRGGAKRQHICSVTEPSYADRLERVRRRHARLARGDTVILTINDGEGSKITV